GITIHLHESKREVEQWKQQFGTSPLQYYYEKLPEFLGPDVLGVHCVWMDEKDIKIMKEKDIKVSHNTISNMYLASGVAPVPEFLKNGIVVSLGVDGAASNNSQDFMELIKATALLHKVARVDPQAITAKQVLRMATIDGARAVLMENEIGSIEKGKKADIIIFDLNNIQMRPVNNPLSQVVYCGKSWNVETVIVDGNIIMENRVIKGVDEQELIWKVQELADDLVEKAGRTELRKQLWYR
ncbi:MAG: amidohydrolase family protein, partial [Candidatus Odinarchaeota archaeon]|nr:amidohydrolase family protein [Candidatus Odinarchaeota archaeon]